MGSLSGLKNGLDVTGLLGCCARLISFFNLLLVEFNIVVLEVPLSERSGVDANDAVLNEGLCADELVVCGVVNNIHNTGLA